MANTLTGMIPELYAALYVVSREMVGFIPAVSRNSSAERAALNQTVRIPIGVSGDLEDVTPGVTPPNTGDTTVNYTDMSITKSRAAPIKWNGEEEMSLGPTGMHNAILAQQFADGMRKLCNEIEVDLALAAKQGASRAYGTAGTTPFATAGDLSDVAGVYRILEDNGAPRTDLQLVMGSAGWFNFRGKMSNLFKVNEAGTPELLRTGNLSERLEGFALRNSAGFRAHTAGTGSGYLVNNAAGIAVDGTAVATDTGTGTILAGDIVTFAADTANKYVVGSALSAGSFSLNKPGARVAIPDNNAITRGASYTPNVGFARTAMALATRAPALPKGGDMADDRMTLVDPFSGLQFEVSLYRLYRQVKIEIALAWGVKAVQSEHIALLLG